MAFTKPWSVSIFEREREHMTQWARQKLIPLIEEGVKTIVVRAPVKSGKREIAEYTAMRDILSEERRVHVFVSAWHRVADDDQREELGRHNLTVFSMTKESIVDDILRWIRIKQAQEKEIVIHLDECDYASGKSQILSRLWRHVREAEHITSILYSATPEEVLFSGEIDTEPAHQRTLEDILAEGVRIEYTPPPGFCGPARFLHEGLVHEATPFFETQTLCPQGKELVAQLLEQIKVDPSRNVLVLRLTYSTGGKPTKETKAYYTFLNHLDHFPELKDFVVMADKSDLSIRSNKILTERIQWSSEVYWRRLAVGVPVLIVIDQTACRSTEWKCHPRIFATHDFRPNKIQYGTLSQAQERTNHYDSTYGGFQPIHIYGNVKNHRLSAGQIHYEDYLTPDWDKKKIDKRTSTEERYLVRSTSKVLHPECPQAGLTEKGADQLLQRLGCYADTVLSARIRGGVRDVPIYEGMWKEATQDTWKEVWTEHGSGKKVRNPFDAAVSKRLPTGIWLGQHRGWKHLTCIESELYEVLHDTLKKLDLGATGNDRNKVCYCEGVLGVFLVKKVGVRTENTLTAYKSMYGN